MVTLNTDKKNVEPNQWYRGRQMSFYAFDDPH